MIAVQQFKAIFGQSLRNEWHNKERLFTPVLFALAVIFIFKFTTSSFNSEIESQIILGQVLVTVFLSLQISFQRIFELDEQDGVFSLMQTYRISPVAWFTAKFCNVFLICFTVLLALFIFLAILNSEQSVMIWKFFAPMILAICALSPLGILLSALTLQASGRQILFPLLYFPLSTPVLISASSSCLELASTAATNNSFAWLGILATMGIVFFTLCLLLFSELVD